MAKSHRLLLSAALLATALGGTARLITAQRATGFSPPGELGEDIHFGAYEIKMYRRSQDSVSDNLTRHLPARLESFYERIRGDQPESGFEILQHGRRVHSQYGFNLRIAELQGGGVSAGLDLTGTGTPDLAITDDCGRQGGGSLFLFECGAQFRPLAHVDSLGTYPELRDLDGNGVPELIVSDDAFYHWPVCRDGEPMPEVILRWQNGKYVPAKDLMFKPAPDPEQLNALAAQIRASSEWKSGFVPGALWTNAVALMYGGHEALGWKFVETAWLPGFPTGGDSSKEDIIGYYLRGRFDESIYWQNMNSSNNSVR